MLRPTQKRTTQKRWLKYSWRNDDVIYSLSDKIILWCHNSRLSNWFLFTRTHRERKLRNVLQFVHPKSFLMLDLKTYFFALSARALAFLFSEFFRRLNVESTVSYPLLLRKAHPCLSYIYIVVRVWDLFLQRSDFR